MSLAKSLSLALVGLFATQIWAAEGQISTDAKVAAPRKFGAFVAIGNPYPSLLGLNGAYNIDNHIRAVAGYGEVEVTSSIQFSGNSITESKVKAQTYSLGADYLFREAGLRPLVGGRVGYFSVSGDGDISLNGFDKSGAYFYSDVGVDWIAGNGFNVGAGLNVALLGASGTSFYANMGYYF